MTKKEQLRLQELEKKAKDSFIENSDFQVREWLETDLEKAEYQLLFDKFFLEI